MRQLYHPSVEEITVEGILYAFSDPLRIQIFADLAMAECGKNCSNYLNIGNETLPKSTLSQHFRVLREAGLIRSERRGVELINSTRCAELKDHFGSMIQAIVTAYAFQKMKKKTRHGV
ncbi:MAG: helix-turn-helix transcriptional regulator [Anaerolineae bacterium]|nr:helix-turn-helix transcriptional regulator [Gloeobacterales cyanobacterium ES-bin-313]